MLHCEYVVYSVLHREFVVYSVLHFEYVVYSVLHCEHAVNSVLKKTRTERNHERVVKLSRMSLPWA